MSTALELALGFVVGAALGAAFFGTLWWTVQRLPRVEHPVVLAIGSLLIRIGLAVAVFAGLAQREGPPYAVGAGVLGFVIVRTLAVRVVRRSPEGDACS